MKIININSSKRFSEYLSDSFIYSKLYFREIYNKKSFSSKEDKVSKPAFFLLKTWGFILYHFFVALRPRKKVNLKEYLFLSPDFLFSETLGFHKYWELIYRKIPKQKIKFIYFSSVNDRFFSKKKGISDPIDTYFSFKSFCKLFFIVLKINILIISINIKFKINRIKDISFLKNIYNLGSLNDYFIYFLLMDFSENIKNKNKKIILAGEFQFWELGLFKKNIKNRFLYQHSGVRYNDSRIEFFKERNNKVNIITHHLSELKYLKKLGFNCVNFAYRLRNNDDWIKSKLNKGKKVFFGSLNIELDKKIILNLGPNIFYKPHPAAKNPSVEFDNIWYENNEDIYPLAYSQSAVSQNLVERKLPFKVIFKKNSDMALVAIKKIIDTSSSKKQLIFKNYYSIDLIISDYYDDQGELISKNFWDEI